MKNHILKLSLTTAIGLLATGCSNTPNTNSEDSAPLFNQHHDDLGHEDAYLDPKFDLYDGMRPDPLFQVRGEPVEYTKCKGAPLQPETKSLIKRIWSKLESEGFSGYDPRKLEGYIYTTEAIYFPDGVYSSGRSISDVKNFQLRMLDLIFSQTLWKEGRHNLFGYAETLVGLNYNHNGHTKTVLVARNTSAPQDKLVFANAFRAAKGYSLSKDSPITATSPANSPKIIPNVLATDEEVPQALIDKWNKLFYDAIQEHGVFKDEFDPAKVLVETTPFSLPFARATPTGIDAFVLTSSGLSSGFAQLDLPIHLKFTGTITDNLTTPNLQTAAQYNLGNMAVGLTHNYANAGNGFNSNASFKSEATFFTTYYANNWFATAHIGGINAHTHNHAWQAATTALTLGYEHESGIRPFVELHRTQLNDYTQTIGFVGVDLDIAQHAVDSYSISAKLKAAAGYNLQTQTFTPNLEWHGTLSLNSGVSFTSALTLSTAGATSINCSFQIER